MLRSTRRGLETWHGVDAARSEPNRAITIGRANPLARRQRGDDRLEGGGGDGNGIIAKYLGALRVEASRPHGGSALRRAARMANRLYASVPVFGPALRPRGFRALSRGASSRQSEQSVADVWRAGLHAIARARLCPARAALPGARAGLFCGARYEPFTSRRITSV